MPAFYYLRIGKTQIAGNNMQVNTIIEGDALEVLKTMPDECVDLTLTDPPYNIGKDYGVCQDKMPDDEYWALYQRWLDEIYRVMRNGVFYISCLSRQVWDVRPLVEKAGFRFSQMLIWYGPNLPGGTRKISLPWMPVSEPILMFWKGSRQNMINPPQSVKSFDVLIHTRPQRSFGGLLNRVHVTQKPVDLYLTIIARTPGQIVLDPFIGSGTTAIAAKACNRDFVGIELNPEYVEMAKQRLADAMPFFEEVIT